MNWDSLQRIADSLRDLPTVDANGRPLVWPVGQQQATNTTVEPVPTVSADGLLIPTEGIGQGVRDHGPEVPTPTPAQRLWQSVHDTVDAIHRQQRHHIY